MVLFLVLFSTMPEALPFLPCSRLASYSQHEEAVGSSLRGSMTDVRLSPACFYLAHTHTSAWSAPSAIGIGGVGFGGQAGAEMTDFLIVLNSKGVSIFYFIFALGLTTPYLQ